MGFFDFFKSNEQNESKPNEIKKPSIDLTDFKFISDNHHRFENKIPTNKNNKGAWRGVRIKSSDNLTFYVSMYNMDGNHPVWGDNIQMAEKQMKLITETDENIVLRGFGTDSMGYSFADYGLTLYKSNNEINNITLHMHDRLVDIVYDKAENKSQTTTNQNSELNKFEDFVKKWNTMPMNDKLIIALQSDNFTNRGAEAYNSGNIKNAIKYFEEALSVMPNNDDSLKNLKICYSEIGNIEKMNEVITKLNYLDLKNK